ncbi:MAG TPA: tail fiber domain-containing protein [Nitrospiraceae bacterium]
MGNPIDLIAPGRVRVGINPAVERIPADIYAGKNDTTGRLVVQVNGFGVSVDGPYVGIGHARGTSDAPTNNVDGDNLGDFEFYAYAGGWRQAAEMRAFVDGAVADGVTPSTHIEFKVTTGGALSTRATLFAVGRLALGSGSRASDADQTANGAATLWVAENGSINAIAAQFSGSNSSAVQYLGRKSRGGSLSAPTTVVQDDGLVIFRPSAYTGTWFDDAGFLRFAVDAAVVANQRPATRFEIYTNLNNAAPAVAFRVLSGGAVIAGAGTPDTTRYFQVVGPTTTFAIARITSTGGGATNHCLRLDAGDNAITGSKFVAFNRPDATEIGSVSQNAAGTVAYNTSSDERLKADIADSKMGLADLMKIRVRQFRYKTDPNNEIVQGFIAQELRAIFPGAVTVGAPAKDCDCDLSPKQSAEGLVMGSHDADCVHLNPWGVDYGRVTPLLVRALQQLADRVAAMDGKGL